MFGHKDTSTESIIFVHGWECCDVWKIIVYDMFS